MLVVPPDAHVRVPRHGALARRQVAHHQLQQRALAGAVGAHQRDAAVAVHPQVEALIQVVLLLAAVRKGHVYERQHRRRQLVARGKVEVEVALLAHGRRQPCLNHLVQDLLLRLGLPHEVRVGTARRDELLQVLDVILLLLVLLHLDDLVLRNRLGERVVVARVVGELLVRQPDDVCAHAVQKILGVADDDQALVVRLQVPLQPHARLQVHCNARAEQKFRTVRLRDTHSGWWARPRAAAWAPQTAHAQAPRAFATRRSCRACAWPFVSA